MSDNPVSDTVFVIDEDPAIYKALCRMGKQLGFSVEAFSSSRSFFSWFETEHASRPLDETALCIVVDARMLVAEMDWYSSEPILSIPKICIGIPEEARSITNMLTVLEGKIIRRPFTLVELERHVEAAFARHAAIRSSRQESSRISANFARLSRREDEVFRLVAQGRTNQEISDLLGISIKTVKAHRGKVMKKTQSKTIADLVRNYEKRELLLTKQNNALSTQGKPS